MGAGSLITCPPQAAPAFEGDGFPSSHGRDPRPSSNPMLGAPATWHRERSVTPHLDPSCRGCVCQTSASVNRQKLRAGRRETRRLLRGKLAAGVPGGGGYTTPGVPRYGHIAPGRGGPLRARDTPQGSRADWKQKNKQTERPMWE